eukprot:3976817-Pyramimonas_sp.AAC.1
MVVLKKTTSSSRKTNALPSDEELETHNEESTRAVSKPERTKLHVVWSQGYPGNGFRNGGLPKTREDACVLSAAAIPAIPWFHNNRSNFAGFAISGCRQVPVFNKNNI